MRCEFCQKTINDGVCANLECSGRQAKKEKLKEDEKVWVKKKKE